jgi:uncharacterized NAD(P)/FAD-binding protein YdhS
MKLGIIGGGGAAVALLAALTRDRLPDIDITVFEPAKTLGPGRAYLADSDTALLNVSAGRMSVLPDTTGHFLRWARNGGHGQAASISPEAFLPRRLFGEYLTDVAQTIADRMADRGRDFRIVGSSARRLCHGTAGFQVLTSDGQRFDDLDRVVLCVGSGGPTDMYQLTGIPGYVNDPYPLWTRLATAPEDARVLVLGTGLTAVDAVLFLLENGHRGAITMASHNGLLPTVRTSATAPALRHLSRAAVRAELAADPVLTVDRLLGLLDAELRAAGIDRRRACVEAQPGEPFARRLRRQLRDARAGGALWQPIIIEAMHESVDLIWHAMTDAERRRFLTDWHHRFINLLSPMPQWTAERLRAAADSGQLRVARGIRGVRRDEAGRSGFVAATGAGDVAADIVVNTARPTVAAIPETAAPLVAGLVESGMARPHPLGGVDVAPASNRVLAADGHEHRGLFALGQLTAGVHYYTSSMLIIGRQARKVADRILADCRP